jgi:probable rRNA maturation factor
MDSIHFFSEQTVFTIKNKSQLRRWITDVIRHHKKKITNLNYIFTSDAYLSEINQKYLRHNSYTDIVTFDQSTNTNYLEADIFISIDRVRANAQQLAATFEDELHRVMVHGILHLVGYKDKTASDKQQMRKRENHFLALRRNSINTEIDVPRGTSYT